MIACRLFTRSLSLSLVFSSLSNFPNLYRVDRVWKSPCAATTAAAAALCNPSRVIPVCNHYHTTSVAVKMGGGAKNGSKAMDRKKRRVALPIWKPVSMSSRPVQGCSVREMKTVPEAVNSNEGSSIGYQVDEMHGDDASCISSSHDLIQDEPIGSLTVAATTSAEDVEQNSQFETLEENQSIFETKSESGVGSRTSEVLHQELVIEEAPHDLSLEKIAEGTTGAEKPTVSVQVDAALIRFVKGKGGSTQRQIEEETGVKIIYPTSKEENFIVIEGVSIESVTKASKKVEIAVEQAVRSPGLDYSHFISLPLAIHPELMEKLYNFQSTILGDATSSQEGNRESESDGDASDDKDDEDRQLESPDVAVKLEVKDNKEHVQVKIGTTDHSYQETHVKCTLQLKRVSYPIRIMSPHSQAINKDLGIDKFIFIKPKTFHLTVLMLKLWNKERVAVAKEVFQGISSEVMDALDNRPVSIRLKGLECMRGSPAKAHVLYVPVEEIGGEGRLLRACQVIIQAYVKAGLVLEKDARQPLKLHATLMNARHRKRKDFSGKRNKKNDSFDARNIFTKFGSEDWGDYPIQEAHLSQRFVFDESGYYHCCASIAFPENMQLE